MSTMYLIRHADAGEPWEYPKDDNERPLSRHGREQAKEMASLIKDFNISQIFTSFADRCQETAQYLARETRAKAEPSAMLTQNRGNVVTSFLRTIPHEPTVVVTHSDNIYAFLKTIHDDDKVEIPPRIAVPCGSFYVVQRATTVFTSVKYVPPGVPPEAPEFDEADDGWVV